jgi:hypothetical protein
MKHTTIQPRPLSWTIFEHHEHLITIHNKNSSNCGLIKQIIILLNCCVFHWLTKFQFWSHVSTFWPITWGLLDEMNKSCTFCNYKGTIVNVSTMRLGTTPTTRCMLLIPNEYVVDSKRVCCWQQARMWLIANSLLLLH